MRQLIACYCLLGMACAAPTEAQVTFSKIADRTTPAPGSSGPFGFFRHASISGNTVAFTAVPSSGATNQWVYTGTVGSVGANLIAQLDTSAGADGTFFNSSMGPVSAISGSNVVFKGGTTLGGQGIYAGTVGSIGATSVANNLTAWPSNPSLNLVSFQGGPSVSENNVVFSVRGGSGSTAANGIFTATVGTPGISVIADSTTPVPGQSVNFSTAFTSGQGGDGGSPSIRGQNVAFIGNWSGGGGIYTGRVGVKGAHLVVDTTTPAPGSPGTFLSFGLAMLSETHLAFPARYTGGSGVFLSTLGIPGVTRIVDNSMLIPGTSTGFSNFRNLAIGGDNVVFHEDHGIFFFDDGVISPVIMIGDALFGSTVTNLHLGQLGYDDTTKQVVFIYELADAQMGVATADVSAIPEPTVLLALGFSAAFASCRRGRRGTR